MTRNRPFLVFSTRSFTSFSPFRWVMRSLTFPELPLSIPVLFLSVPGRSAMLPRTVSSKLHQSRGGLGECRGRTVKPTVSADRTRILGGLRFRGGRRGELGLLRGSHAAEGLFYPGSLLPPWFDYQIRARRPHARTSPRPA